MMTPLVKPRLHGRYFSLLTQAVWFFQNLSRHHRGAESLHVAALAQGDAAAKSSKKKKRREKFSELNFSRQSGGFRVAGARMAAYSSFP